MRNSWRRDFRRPRFEGVQFEAAPRGQATKLTHDRRQRSLPRLAAQNGIVGGYAALVPPLDWPEYGCRFAALEDLACMKPSAIGDRGAKKDFIDIYALGRTHFTLEQMLGFYRQKFDTPDLGHTVIALAYFDDAEEERDVGDVLGGRVGADQAHD